MKNPAPYIFALVTSSILSCGCGSGADMNFGQPGKSFSYVAGEPSFDIEAIPGANNGGVEVLLSILPGFMTFTHTPNGFLSTYDMSVMFFRRGTTNLLHEDSWTDTTLFRTYDETQRSEPIEISRIVRVPPGQYRLSVTLSDRTSGRWAVRHQDLVVPDSLDVRPVLGRIVLQFRDSTGGAKTIVPFNIPEDMRRLDASARLFGAAAAHVSRWDGRLFRFRLESEYALPPQAFALIQGAGEAHKYWLDNPDTIYRTSASGEADEVVRMKLPTLRPGLYDVEYTAAVSRAGVDGDTTVSTHRVFSIKPQGFPRPTTLRDLVESMVYLTNASERRQLREARTPETLKAVFDSLWLTFQPVKSEASALVRRYYTLVEEANRQFSDLKEGWKTDRGMLYIVLGPPSEVSNNFDRQIWYYAQPASSGERGFVFRKVIVGTGDISFTAYVLQRDIQYERFWDTMVARWRSGRGK